MKAWRNESAKINARRAAGSTEAPARKQMQEGLMLSKMFPIKNAGNWLLDGLLHKGGYLAPVKLEPADVVGANRMSFFSCLKQAFGM